MYNLVVNPADIVSHSALCFLDLVAQASRKGHSVCRLDRGIVEGLQEINLPQDNLTTALRMIMKAVHDP